MKYTHGQKVKCTICEIEINDAKISINKDGNKFICQNEIDGASADDLLGYKYSWSLYDDDQDVRNLRPVEKILDDFEEGNEK